jgi:hypothetical protein
MLRMNVAMTFFALVLSATAAIGQTPSTSSDQAPAANQGPTPGPGGESQSGASKPPTNKELIADCVAQAKTKGLKGAERQKAVNDCIAAQKPKLAARRECRQQGKAQGLSDDALKQFVTTCMNQDQPKQ